MSVAYIDSLKQIKRNKFQTARRWIFGSLTVGFAIPSVIYSLKATKAQKKENEAWDDYMQPNLTPYKYEELYNIYKDKVKETNKYVIKRNSYFTIAGITGIGFVISIPF